MTAPLAFGGAEVCLAAVNVAGYTPGVILKGGLGWPRLDRLDRVRQQAYYTAACPCRPIILPYLHNTDKALDSTAPIDHRLSHSIYFTSGVCSDN